MKNMIKELHSDRFIPYRTLSAPKSTLINPILVSQIQIKADKCNASTKSATSRKQIAFSKSITTQQQTVLGFVSSLPTSFTSSTKRRQTIKYYESFEIPNVVDNFYYNNLDISKQDFVAVGTNSSLVMHHNEKNKTISYDYRKSQSLITCVKFGFSDDILMSGNQSGLIEVHDAQTTKTVRFVKTHFSRVGRIQNSMADPFIIYSGSKDSKINVNDLRKKNPVATTYYGQQSQICSLSLTQNYLASGGNAGNILIWDIRAGKLIETLTHHNGSGIKALSWCPWRSNTLVSGGGKNDKQIVIYNFKQRTIERNMEVKNQVTNICWRNSTQQMIYSYGDQYKSRIKVVKFNNFEAQNINLHRIHARVLAVKVNKNKDNLLYSLSGGDNLHYWDLDSNENKTKIDVHDILSTAN